MRIKLALQGLLLVREILRAQLLVLDLYLLALTNQVNHIATTRNDARHDKIPQRMQIMMHQGVDRLDIKLMVQ